MSNIFKIIVGVLVLFISLVILGFSYYVFQLTPTSNEDKIIQIEIPKGSSGSAVASILKDNKLIRDTTIFRAYLKIHNIDNISYGTYELNKAMGVKQIVDIISSGKAANKDIKILFKEGLNMRGIAKAIAANTNNTEEDVFSLLNDEEYIDSLIAEYWFLDDVIKNDEIYYPLEGYLAPNTYQFADKDVSVDMIFRRMLDQTNEVLTPYKNQIKDYSIHEFLTLASIVESEGLNDDDMAKIASVFYNRIEYPMAFGSCVTACYATKTEPCISTQVDKNFVSPYNTYLPSMAGDLPIGPVSNPGVVAIEATLNPADTDYLYFLSDKYKKTYFSKSYAEHTAKISELKASGLWLTE